MRARVMARTRPSDAPATGSGSLRSGRGRASAARPTRVPQSPGAIRWWGRAESAMVARGEAMAGAFQRAYEESMRSPEPFWARAAQRIHWQKPFAKVLADPQAPRSRWFAGGELNPCYNAIDRHVEGGRADQLAVIYDSPVTATKQTLTYRQLREEVARFAGALASLGVSKGDRVVIYMPMIPETLIAMHACARIGAIHSVVFGGFAAHELAGRIQDATPKVVVSASCGIEIKRVVEYKPLLDRAIE